MKTNVLKYLASAAVAVGFAISAHAVPISGSVQMSGSVTMDTMDLSTASTASFSNPAGTVVIGLGTSYSGVATGTPVNFFGFNIAAGSQTVAPLWSFVYAGNTYSFSLATITSVGSNLGANVRSSSDLLIKGIGTVSITGGTYDTTDANWSFDVTDTSGGGTTFKFAFANSDTTIPDGGATVMLLGAALSGLALMRRKLA